VITQTETMQTCNEISFHKCKLDKISMGKETIGMEKEIF